MVYLQQITPYVDTKDYEFRWLGQRVIEDVDEAHQDTALAHTRVGGGARRSVGRHR